MLYYAYTILEVIGLQTKTRKKWAWWKKLLLVIGIILALIATLIGWLVISFLNQAKINEENQRKMQKPDSELIGTRLEIPRDGEEAVSVNIYYPHNRTPGEALPAVLNIHGGAFISGDADTLDTQSQRLADSWNMVIVGVDYKLATAVTIEYAVEEVTDTVLYLAQNAQQYDIDPQKIVTMGYSAGGYHAMAAALQLKLEGFELAAQVLCYPFISDIQDLYNALDQEDKALAPALFLIAETDPISQGSLPYEQLLSNNGVDTEIITYADAMHGFMEENNPEYAELQNIASRNAEQEALARDAEEKIGEWLQSILQ